MLASAQRVSDLVLDAESSMRRRSAVAADQLRGWPNWLQVLAIWGLARLFSLLLLACVVRQQGPNPWSPDHPSLLQWMNGWDVGYYATIATTGYPLPLPTDASGALTTSPWAFYPLFPHTARLVMEVTGWSWLIVAPLLATVVSLPLTWLTFRLFRRHATTGTALFAVALFSFQPAAPVLGLGYAESFGLALIAGILLAVDTRRYLLAVPLVLVLGWCRPMAAPVALAVGLLWLWQLLQLRSGPGRRADLARLTALVVAAGIAMLTWPAVMALATGDWHAYFATEAAWHGSDRVVPGELWFRVARRLFGPWLGLLAPVVAVLAMVGLMASEPARRLGATLHVWTCAVLLYLVAVIVPNGAVFRLLLPTFPFALMAASISRSRAYRAALIVLVLLGQIVWVVWLWHWTGVGPDGARETSP